MTNAAADTARLQRRDIRVGPAPDDRLAAVDFGDPAAPTDVVFLHANGFNARTYRSLLEPLADRLHILAVDLQGFGRSPQRVPAEGRENALDFRDDVLRLLDQVATGRPVLMAGHSLGGMVSLLAAAEAPERVRGLALFEPVIMPRELSARLVAQGHGLPADDPMAVQARGRRSVFPSRDAAFAAYQGRGAFRTWPDAVLRDYLADGLRDRADGEVELSCAPAWESSVFRAHAHDIWGAMARIRAPVTILRAEERSTCAVSGAEDWPGEGPFRVATVPGTTHFLPMEQPERVRDVLLSAAH